MSGFGLTPKTTAAGFSFGATTTPAAAAPAATSGFSFGGAPKAATPSLGLGGAPAAGGSFGFGAATPAATTTAAAPAATGFSFGTPAASTAAAPVAFGTPAASSAPTLSFGTPASSAASGGLSFGTPAATTTPATGLFGTTTAAAAAPASSFSFGKPAAATTAAPTLGGFGTPAAGSLFGKTTAVGATPATSAAPAFVGLGGVDVNTSSQPKPGESKQDNVKVKETAVPDPIAKTIDALKTHIKQQKSISSDIGRSSISKISNVSSEIRSLHYSLQEIANSVEGNYNQIKLLRKETSKAIQSAEMSQRTHDTPPGLQFENTAPFVYIQNLVQKYETDLINFRNQIVLTENHMKSLTSPSAISPEDLKRGLQHINECFVSLAGRLHEIHQKVEVQKEQFLNLRKYRLRDTTNVFAKLEATESQTNTAKISSGPTPFSNISGMAGLGMSFSLMGTAGTSAANQTGKA